jgi:hypothetical protein
VNNTPIKQHKFPSDSGLIPNSKSSLILPENREAQTIQTSTQQEKWLPYLVLSRLQSMRISAELQTESSDEVLKLLFGRAV